MRDGTYRVSLLPLKGALKGKRATGTLWLKRISIDDRSLWSGDTVDRRRARELQDLFYGAVAFDGTAIDDLTCHTSSGRKEVHEIVRVSGKKPMIRKLGACDRSHPLSCDPVYPGVLVTRRRGGPVQLLVSQTHNYRGDVGWVGARTFVAWIWQADTARFCGTWRHLFRNDVTEGLLCARLVSRKQVDNSPCDRVRPPVSGTPMRPSCTCRKTEARQLVAELAPEARNTLLRTSIPRGIDFEVGGGRYSTVLRSDCGAKMLDCKVDAIRSRADPHLVSALDCQFRLADRIGIDLSGHPRMRLGDFVRLVQRQIDAQLPGLARKFPTCSASLPLRVTGDADPRRWVQLRRPSDKNVSLNWRLHDAGSDVGFIALHYPPGIELRFWKRPRAASQPADTEPTGSGK